MSWTDFRLGIATVASLAVLALAYDARASISARVPNDMPKDAKFVATGYNPRDNEARGQWIACNEDRERRTDFCRVTNQQGVVIFQGDYLPAGSARPLTKAELKLGKFDPKKDWVYGPAEAEQVPVIPLQNGTLMIPVADSDALASRWASDPEELRNLTASKN